MYEDKKNDLISEGIVKTVTFFTPSAVAEK